MKNQYDEKQQLSEGVYVVPDACRSWGYELNHNFELLNENLKKKKVTFTNENAEIGDYDGTENKTIDVTVNKITENDVDSMFIGE